jgi:putative phosphoribosyl transferase
MTMFADRTEAGQRLAPKLGYLRDEEPVVLGLPRGGVPVAAEVAHALGAPLDVIVVRKLGVPFQPELGMGAVGEDGIRVINEEVVRIAGITPNGLARVERRERAEVEARAQRFRAGRPRVALAGRPAILVDDGIATGSTMRAACQVARAAGARRVVVAVPVAPPEVVPSFRHDADEVICLETPSPFYAVGQWYADFTQVSDAEVTRLLQREPVAQPTRDDPPTNDQASQLVRDDEVTMSVAGVHLAGHLTIPAGASGIVLFAHGSGSSRHSPRNRYVASVLNQAGLGTLLLDLLTPVEELNRENVFDIELLGTRLVGATHWLADELGPGTPPIGFFGASTGAAAALFAATDPGVDVGAVVSRGGRPDLAGGRLGLVRAPTLLIVGGRDTVVAGLNKTAQRELAGCKSRLEVVPGATHLFEEPGTLQAVAELARDWFLTHLARERAG